VRTYFGILSGLLATIAIGVALFVSNKLDTMEYDYDVCQFTQTLSGMGWVTCDEPLTWLWLIPTLLGIVAVVFLLVALAPHQQQRSVHTV